MENFSHLLLFVCDVEQMNVNVSFAFSSLYRSTNINKMKTTTTRNRLYDSFELVVGDQLNLQLKYYYFFQCLLSYRCLIYIPKHSCIKSVKRKMCNDKRRNSYLTSTQLNNNSQNKNKT